MTLEEMFEGIHWGTPQCSIRYTSDVQCAWMSSVRVQHECKACGNKNLSFLCKGHQKGVAAEVVSCYHCKSPSVEVKVSLGEGQRAVGPLPQGPDRVLAEQ